MAAAGALGMEGVDGAALERLDRVLDEARSRSACRSGSSPGCRDRRRPKGAVDGRRGVVPQSSCSFSAQGRRRSARRGRPGVRHSLAGKAEVHRQAVGLDHAPMCQGLACRWSPASRAPTGAAAEHGGDAAHQRVVDLLRADEMDVACRSRRPWILPSPAMISVPGR